MVLHDKQKCLIEDTADGAMVLDLETVYYREDRAKMGFSPPFLVMNKGCDEAVAEVMQQLVSANLEVLRTFDLQMSRTMFMPCTCPNHGTEQCDCQLVVLLVYRDRLPPTTLVAHGHDGKTWFALVDTPEQRAAPRSMAAIRQALVPPEVIHMEKR